MMSCKSASVVSVLGIVSCAGCTPTPQLDIARTGSLPAAASSFAPVQPLDTPASATLSACLATHGIRMSTKPVYLAQIIEMDRPGAVGTMGLPPTEAAPGAAAWLPGATPGRRSVRSLVFSLIDASTGQVVYRIVVSERYRPKAKRPLPADLAQLACASLTAPPAPSAR